MWRACLPVVLLAAAIIAGALGRSGWADGFSSTPYSDAQAIAANAPAVAAARAAAVAAAPVTSVNGGQGVVTIPTVQRQVSGALSATSGSVTWTFPASFSHMPTCWTSLAYSGSGYSFDQPIVSAISTTSVTETITAHPTSLSIASVLTLPITLTLTSVPPAGTTVTLSCVGALP